MNIKSMDTITKHVSELNSTGGKYGLDISKLNFENLECVKINTADMNIIAAD